MKNKLFLMTCISLLVFLNCKKNTSPFSSGEEFGPKQLTSTGQDYQCYWAPNGELISFLSARNTYDPYVSEILSELWIMDKYGSNQRPLIAVNELYEITTIRSVSWAPNSNDMVVQLYGYQPSRVSEIWRVTIDGNKTQLSSPDDFAEQPSYSPDGSHIAYIIQNSDPSYYQLYVANTNLTDTLLIAKGMICDYDWESDSQGLIYSLFDKQNKNYDLWKASVNGSVNIRISETSESEEMLSCSSDGQYVAFANRDALYYSPVNNFNPMHIIDNARLPQWIPNRNYILFLSVQSHADTSFWTESWIVDLHGNVIEKIAEGEASWTAFSSTGDYFVYSANGNIWLDCL